ncbi:hypothetical protein BK131_14035 [Paenibacillus amylolyticus]|uniref:Bacteriocin n=1 Tax=Paenibacillus amylolyticus TaxID=1451 RepID=A0A1R1BVC2_PAEAM|nr:hypothetical protein [Paenibacillus amylolyticus]OMF13781.1 hypothetical protein BK131_14035 [Paenibacillus amylolyticus]
MTNAMNINNHFIELTSEEMMFVEGGSVGKALAGAAGAILIGAAPVVGILAGIGGSVATPVAGVAAGIGAASAMVSSGSYLLDYATKK